MTDSSLRVLLQKRHKAYRHEVLFLLASGHEGLHQSVLRREPLHGAFRRLEEVLGDDKGGLGRFLALQAGATAVPSVRPNSALNFELGVLFFFS